MLGWSMLDWFGCSWVMPNKLSIMFEAWSICMSLGSLRGRITWWFLFMAIIWVSWKERDAWWFERSSSLVDVLTEKVCFFVACSLFLLLFSMIPLLQLFWEGGWWSCCHRWLRLGAFLDDASPLADIFLKKESLVRVCFYFKIEIYICLLVSCTFLCFRW